MRPQSLSRQPPTTYSVPSSTAVPDAASGVGFGGGGRPAVAGGVVDDGLGDGMLVGAPAAGDDEPAVDEGAGRLLPWLRQVGDRDPLARRGVVAEGRAQRLLGPSAAAEGVHASRAGCPRRCARPGTGTARGRARVPRRPARRRGVAASPGGRGRGAARSRPAPAGRAVPRGRMRARARGSTGAARPRPPRARSWRGVAGVDHGEPLGRLTSPRVSSTRIVRGAAVSRPDARPRSAVST